ncbi:MAG TPA: hypothetical protein VG942_19255 [Hyphomonadaceae bacterium]|nr:hypothetical protein [Hyphomonadaceae bacterium]
MRRGLSYPHALAIETLRNAADEDEYVIVLLGETGQPLTRTHPYDLLDAFGDCEYEFGVKRDEWTEVLDHSRTGGEEGFPSRVASRTEPWRSLGVPAPIMSTMSTP